MKELFLGIDIGSTTVKLVAVEEQKIVYKKYERHYSKVREKACEMLSAAKDCLKDKLIKVALTGSAGLGVAKAGGINFIQEVFATRKIVEEMMPDTDVVIELGGEDAKIIYLSGELEERMNGTCAGGTGAFIDQMAVLLDATPSEMDELSLKAERLYTIASRCGVFAKTDVQPLLNQGAKKEDIAASIFQAVVDQTVTGLAQGREITGNVLFLGGPLYFFKGLQKRFYETLGLNEKTARFPEIAPFAVALGAAYYASNTEKTYTYEQLLEALQKTAGEVNTTHHLEPLFENEQQYREFVERHKKSDVVHQNLEDYSGGAYLGVDSGSTTTKMVLIGEDNQLLYSYYSSNKGNPLVIVREQLLEIYRLCGDRVRIKGCAATGYGEELIKNAFHMDFGLVETVAHFRAAKHFCPNVDFIIDIGGQDMKCFKIHNNCIDNIMLNEACSSGCGSFIETFAKSMGYTVQEFCKRGIMARRPIDLGSRCTVFMNSSVKQAQKDGAPLEDISAGLSVSVVKNALYKVIRVNSADELGENVVVQGGTFLNDAILRSFEKELKKEVIRPSIAGLMGAYGAALYAKEHTKGSSLLLSAQETLEFTHSAKSIRCGGCTNHCNLTINVFSGDRRYVSGNRCEKPLGKGESKQLPDMYAYKMNRLKEYIDMPTLGNRPKVGIPLVLNLYELLPFWYRFFDVLGYDVVVSGVSNRAVFNKGQNSIPSDTVCYPAKLVHGHVELLAEKGVDTIFYPCMTYNFNEGHSDNCYNCPVVAYYPELLSANMKCLKDIRFLMPYFELNDPKALAATAYNYFSKYLPGVTRNGIKKAVDEAYKAQQAWQKDIADAARKTLDYAKENNLPIAVLAGRPYHIDPEINHGINQLITSYGMVVVSEDCVYDLTENQKVNVLNQWTYHSRMYKAAKFAVDTQGAQLIQLVSFGCGIDAITTDENREIVERGGKIYTQLKIDDINNLGAVKIRIRSLLEAVAEGEKNAEITH